MMIRGRIATRDSCSVGKLVEIIGMAAQLVLNFEWAALVDPLLTITAGTVRAFSRAAETLGEEVTKKLTDRGHASTDDCEHWLYYWPCDEIDIVH